MQLGVFPLPIFLLPGGVTRLRIFEPRYIRLVKEAITQQGFALSTYNNEPPYNSSEHAAWVDIIDFSTLEDGLLSIDVKAKSLVSLRDFTIEKDQLKKATAKQIEHWSAKENCDKSAALAQELESIFNANPDFSALYQQHEYDNPNWVCARFIEILPLSIQKKYEFIQPNSYGLCLDFLHTLIIGEK
ncbi:hypothetical protein PULV_b0879 [Pseudoalteromonas ulvae UL12]|uniref:Lon N-terminal domain-containing protein n=1 Tax=Pseudoalteromonas ulvae TaxID=107327 RepID=A0A244CR90_PSEDV|nr:LON peptidase substrate-binding domain-containing protein [Pseudoalteromonas ulvae]MBE0366135.1 hypothetical protein [Pseudoalteromonas ulvae UL12]OUL58147.1 hypothetical protein B1199_07275 [Pseudoalteromonas ulvae]